MLRRRCRKEKCEMMQDEKEVKGQVRGRKLRNQRCEKEREREEKQKE